MPIPESRPNNTDSDYIDELIEIDRKWDEHITQINARYEKEIASSERRRRVALKYAHRLHELKAGHLKLKYSRGEEAAC